MFRSVSQTKNLQKYSLGKAGRGRKFRFCSKVKTVEKYSLGRGRARENVQIFSKMKTGKIFPLKGQGEGEYSDFFLK